MKNALFLYSEATGTGQVNRHLDKILARLRKAFDQVDAVKTTSMEEGMEKAKAACGVYHSLIVSGGDGTFNHILNALMECENVPILGYFNGGTISDIGHNFGIHGSYKRALKIIEGGETCTFDVGKIEDRYFAYVAAIGAYADIPYVTQRKYKKRLGRIVYYFKAVSEAFRPKKIPCRIEADGVVYEQKVPFILCLNGKNVGGFPVNTRHSSIRDGKIELFLTKPGLFNGLLHYLLFKMRTRKIVAKNLSITVDYPLPWCIDGEKGPMGSVRICVVPSNLRIYCSSKCSRRL